jgi:hypothetical protein
MQRKNFVGNPQPLFRGARRPAACAGGRALLAARAEAPAPCGCPPQWCAARHSAVQRGTARHIQAVQGGGG